jgi:YD repeat-containing protein
LNVTKGAIVVGMSPWDAAQRGIGAFERGSVTTLFDERDLPIEVQILDSEKRVVSRFIRAYDASGRIMEENQIQENPALMFEGRSGELDDKQLEAMNKGLRSMMSGKNGTGKSFTYDPQGRVTEVRDRNWASDTVTTTTYNEHGDIIEERQTIRSNLAYPHSVAYTIDEDGTLIPDRPNGVPDPPPPPERTVLNITEYRYEYDQNGNWTERTVVNRQESYEQSTVYRRTLTYF